MNLSVIKEKGAGARISFLCSIVSLIGLVAYLIYGIVYDYLDSVVLIAFLAGALCAAGYCFREEAVLGLLNLVSAACLSYGIGLFFLNSFPVWADNLNGITMYASRGGLPPVIAILVILVLAILLEIVSCFMGKGGKTA